MEHSRERDEENSNSSDFIAATAMRLSIFGIRLTRNDKAALCNFFLFNDICLCHRF